MLLPHAQYTMQISQHNEQSGHCIVEEISNNQKYSVLPMLVEPVDQFLDCFCCEHRLLLERLSGVDLVF